MWVIIGDVHMYGEFPAYFYTIYTLEFYFEHILKKIYIQGVFIWRMYVVFKNVNGQCG